MSFNKLSNVASSLAMNPGILVWPDLGLLESRKIQVILYQFVPLPLAMMDLPLVLPMQKLT